MAHGIDKVFADCVVNAGFQGQLRQYMLCKLKDSLCKFATLKRNKVVLTENALHFFIAFIG